MRPGIPLLLAGLVALATSAAARAHPAVGIVMDRAGNVYYSDLEQVWRLAPDGGKRVAVAGVHTHELWLDAEGDLYGEHLWYEGEKTDRWGHYVWRLSAAGRLERVVPAREGFRSDWSFVRDAAGNGYWAEGGGEGAAAVVRRKAPEGGVATVASGAFGRVKWLAAAPEGTLFFTAMAARAHDLYRVTPGGEVRRLAHGLAAPSLLDRLPTSLFSPWHATFGLWPDGRGGAYVAVTADRAVKHVSATGEVAVAARSLPPWSPTGGLLATDGSLWILEGGLPGRVRVVRISPDGRRRVF